MQARLSAHSFRALCRRPVARAVILLMLGVICRAEAAGPIPIDERSFGCISALTAVRGFFVGNLLGHLPATLEVARSPTGGIYPPGSVVQLVPTEVMVKQTQGFSPATHDWEFFELDASKTATTIRKRGFAEVINRFGGNCFACHIKARAEWDFVCETGHGCDPIPLTAPMIVALQHTDPRCPNADRISAADAAALSALAKISRPKPADPVPDKKK